MTGADRRANEPPADGDSEEPLLAGRSVIICRSASELTAASARLARLGATCTAVPLQRAATASDGGASLRDALANIDRYDWIAVTSANGARALAAAIGAMSEAPGAATASVAPTQPSSQNPLPLPPLAAVGPATVAALARGGIDTALVAPEATAAALAAAFPDPTGDGRKPTVLLAIGEAADETLATGLAKRGYRTERVDAYRMIPIEPDVDPTTIRSADVVLFTAPSTVALFVERFSIDRIPPTVVCIGPRTLATAEALGIEGPSMASDHTIDGLIDALVDTLGSDGAGFDAGSSSAGRSATNERRGGDG